VENGPPDSVVTSLGLEPLLSQSGFQESIFLDLSKRLGAKLNHSRVNGLDFDEWRRMLQLRLPIAASRTPEQIIKQALPGISANARQGSQVTTEAGDKVGTKRRFSSGFCGSIESLAANTSEIHESAASS
jgi:hypothetical protein